MERAAVGGKGGEGRGKIMDGGGGDTRNHTHISLCTYLTLVPDDL